MKRFIVTLSDEHRAKLEVLRKTLGLRSEAEAIRSLIEGAVEADPVPQRARAASAVRQEVRHKDGDPRNNDLSNLSIGPVRPKPGSLQKKGR